MDAHSQVLPVQTQRHAPVHPDEDVLHRIGGGDLLQRALGAGDCVGVGALVPQHLDQIGPGHAARHELA